MPSEARLKLLLRRQRDGIRFCVLFAVFAVLYAAKTVLFDISGRGFFALCIYLGLIALGWRAIPAAVSAAVGRNDPCACGSGLKYQRCCRP